MTGITEKENTGSVEDQEFILRYNERGRVKHTRRKGGKSRELHQANSAFEELRGERVRDDVRG